MLNHLVMMKLKEMSSAEKEENQRRLVHSLEQLKDKIEVIDHLEVGINFSSRPAAMDIVLVSQFKDENDLDYYRNHPDHLKVLDFIKEVVAESKVVDYWK